MALTKIPASFIDTASGINGLIYPSSDGTTGQFLKTDGSGNLSFATVDTSISANSIGITEINVSDGTSGQFLQTNGSGTLSFASVSEVVAVGLRGGTTNVAITTNNLVITGRSGNINVGV
jgi:hypothetical protein